MSVFSLIKGKYIFIRFLLLFLLLLFLLFFSRGSTSSSGSGSSTRSSRGSTRTYRQLLSPKIVVVPPTFNNISLTSFPSRALAKS